MRVITFETEGTKILSFRRSPKGKEEKVIRSHMWRGNPKELRKQAEGLREE